MTEQIKRLLEKEHIELFGILPIEEVTIIRPTMLPENAKSVVILAVPYDDGTIYHDGVSAYAHVEDYHRFYKELFDRLVPCLEKTFPGKTFCGFADHSPVLEKDAAIKAGLGVMGKNSLLIHPEYGSFLFLGEVITDATLPYSVHEFAYCKACRQCVAACPVGAIGDSGIDATKCLSALSQKKRLSEEEMRLLREHKVAWGCDICQNACPYNRGRKHTEIPFFLTHRHGEFSAQEVENMSDEDFASFAFSWRGRRRICENLYNIAKLDLQGEKTNNFT